MVSCSRKDTVFFDIRQHQSLDSRLLRCRPLALIGSARGSRQPEPWGRGYMAGAFPIPTFELIAPRLAGGLLYGY
jgi:hypothetical protein